MLPGREPWTTDASRRRPEGKPPTGEQSDTAIQVPAGHQPLAAAAAAPAAAGCAHPAL